MEKTNNSPSGEEQKAKDKAKTAETKEEKTAVEIEKAKTTEKAKLPPKSKFETEVERIANSYAPHYPNVQSLHFTSDKMVFLEQDLAQAQAHQLQLGEGKVITVKINQQ